MTTTSLVGYRAPLVFTGWDVLRDAVVVVRGGQVVEIVEHRELSLAGTPVREISVDGVILPGLVNAHTHLEYTNFSIDVAPDADFATWVLSVSRARRETPANYDWRSAAAAGLLLCLSYGVTAVADIVTHGGGLAARETSPVRGRSYIEAVRVLPGKSRDAVRRFAALQRTAPPRIAVGLSPHAPYSVSREALECLGHRATPPWPMHMHVAESAAEIEWVASGTGPLLINHQRLGLRFELDGVGSNRSPIGYLHDLGLLGSGMTVAHAVHVDAADIAVLAATGTHVAICPRSNLRLQGSLPPLRALLNGGVSLGIGTDSTMSSPDLDVLAELRTAYAGLDDPGPRDAARLLRAATVDAAEAVGVAGGLRPGGPADFAVWSADDDITDLQALLLAPAPRCQATYIGGLQVFHGSDEGISTA